MNIQDQETKSEAFIEENSPILIEDPEAVVEKAEGRARVALKKKHGWWPDEKRIEVASLYAAGVVSSRDLAKLTGVPDTAIRTWRTQDWWVELLEQIHASVDNDTVSKLTKIVDHSLEVIQDRLINGDYIYNKKNGEIARRPVSMRDATIVAATIVDKRQLLRGKPTSRSEKITVDARLSKLAEEFARFTKSIDVTPESREIVSEA